MGRILLTLVTLVAWLPANARSDNAKDDPKQIEGKWIPTSAELSGQKFPDEILTTMKLTITKDKYSVKLGEVLDEGTIKLETGLKPKGIDITGTEGPNKGKTILAIFELSGDTLRICYDLQGKKRPTDFKTAKDTKQFLVTYKREKP